MRHDVRTYSSGLVEHMWIAECPICHTRQEVAREFLARMWEETHRQRGCRRKLVHDESGRGWVALPPPV